MPFALVIVGLLLVVTGVKNTQAAFGAQVLSDFTGPGNFTYWIASMGAVGALGYIPALKQFSIAFMTLLIIAMLLAEQKANATSGGFFGMLSTALNAGPATPQSADDSASSASTVTGQAQDLLQSNSSQLNLNINLGANNSDARENFGKVVDVAKFFVGF